MTDLRLLPVSEFGRLLALRRALADPGIWVERDPSSGYWHVEYETTGHTGGDFPTPREALVDAVAVAVAVAVVRPLAVARSVAGDLRHELALVVARAWDLRVL